MGRKSNRKNLSRQVRKQALRENNRWKSIAYSIILPAVGLLIWSFILVDKTLIKTGFVLLPGLLGGLLGTILLTFLWRKFIFPFWAILFYGMLSGASLPIFLFIASNYYLRESNTFQAEFNIVRTGNHSKRNSACRTPYPVVFYGEIEKELPFECEYEKSISNFKKVRLELQEGLLGFHVIQKKELVP